MAEQSFGGSWTTRKLEALAEYVNAYLTVMSTQPFNLTYLDGFAGRGGRNPAAATDPEQSTLVEEDPTEIELGSALRIITLPREFHNYIFVEKKPSYVADLKANLESLGTGRQFEVLNDDINEFLLRWCPRLQKLDRCLMFLDPYGMQVRWEALQAIAKTKSVDACVLIPIQGVLRALPHSGPRAEWERRLDAFFGTTEWMTQFYRLPSDSSATQPELGFEEETHTGSQKEERQVDYVGLSQFMVARLKSLFAYVSDQPILLRNDKGVVLFVLCFVAGNERGAPIAKKIANHICKTYNLKD